MSDDLCIHDLAVGTCSICKPRPDPPPLPRKPTTSPRSADDPIAPFRGTKDISVPVYDVEPYVGSDWLVAHGYPHDLRPHGWVYLRAENKLAARVRALRMAWRDERPMRTGQTDNDFGPGLVFEVDPATWELFDQDLGADAESMHQGYRYHLTDRGGRVHYLMAGGPIPDGDWELEG